MNFFFFRTDPVINPRLTESMYSVEGLKFLHQDSHVVMLPKGLPSVGHNVNIKYFIRKCLKKKKRSLMQLNSTYLINIGWLVSPKIFVYNIEDDFLTFII